jgi:hypothetical protein
VVLFSSEGVIVDAVSDLRDGGLGCVRKTVCKLALNDLLPGGGWGASLGLMKVGVRGG